MESPVRRQYLTLKQRHPAAILLFRLGDFYETFDDDARLVARELDIVLTSRDAGGGTRVPLAGIPAVSLDMHLARLVKRGHKVAICEQLADPSTVKGLLPRDIVRVVTPGTVTEPGLLPASENNYLVALVGDHERAGLAYCDVTTGEFATTEVRGPDARARLLGELARLRPAELLLAPSDPLFQPPEHASNDGAEHGEDDVAPDPLAGYTVSHLDRWQTDLQECQQVLRDQFQVAALDAFGCERLPCATRSAGALLFYLRDHQTQSLLNLQPLTTYRLDDFMQLDESTISSLDLWGGADRADRGAGARHTLLSTIDRTKTGMGARLLRKWLARPLLDGASILDRQSEVATFVDDTTFRTSVRDVLGALPDLERLAGRVIQKVANPHDLALIRLALTAIPGLLKLLDDSSSTLAKRWMHELPRCDVALRLLVEALVDEPPPILGEVRVVRPGYRPDLDEIAAGASESRAWVASLEARERERTGIKSLKVGYNRVFGYYLEVTRGNRVEIPVDYQRKQTLTTGERYVTPDLKEHEAIILSAQERFARLEREIFGDIVNRIAQEGHDLIRAAALLARLDATASLAEVGVRQRWVRPEVGDDDQLHIRAGRHPVVEHTVPPGSFVPNDAALANNSQQIVILTGPNMAGKSTYLRQVALIVLLAQIGSWVPAEAARIGVVDRIFTRVGARDDLAQGQSTFMVEMLELAYILNQATAKSLIVLDEVGRGTSTYDGLAIARATVEYLHNAPKLGAKTLFASHYHELIDLARVLPRVVNYNVAVSEEGDRVIFLHKIVPGGADRSYGIHVARLAGVPRAVTRRASEILLELERGKGRSKAQPSRQVREIQMTLTDGNGYAVGAEQHVLRELSELDLLAMSPLDALARMYELQQRVRGQA